MIWYALLIPLLISVVGFFLFRKKIAWWELFVPTGASLLFIVISFYSMKSTTLSDVEYNGYMITEARYYESYDTWVHKICSNTYPCGTYTTGSGKNRTTHTKYCVDYYDCSYCDHNAARYCMYDTSGAEMSITELEYNSLIKKWSATPKRVELNRNIVYHGGCGKDGDMYTISWNNKPETSITTTYTKDFTNILKCNHSAFNFPVIEPKVALKKGLYDYPKIGEHHYQNSVLGLDSIQYKNKAYFRAKMNYLNGMMGEKHKIRVYTLLFKNKDIDVAFLQEAYWDGGNQNELVICIGVDDYGNINWVKPFSWTDNKRILVDIREDVSELKTLDTNKIYDVYFTSITKYWKYKSFKDFNYLSFEPSKGQLIFVYILTFIVSIGVMVWCVMNEIDE